MRNSMLILLKALHFFQNITSLGIPYLTVMEVTDGSSKICNSKSAGSCLDWDWLMGQEGYDDTTYVRHIRLPVPFVMKCNGKEELAVLYQKDGESLPTSACAEVRRN